MSAASATVSFQGSVLPWSLSPDDESRFRRILRRVVFTAGIVCAVMPWLPRPVAEPRSAPPVPPVARLVLEPERAPPALPRPERPAPQAPAPVEAAIPPPRPVAVKPPPPKPAAQDTPESGAAAARRRAAATGVLALSQELNALREAPLAVQLKPVPTGPGVGSGSGPGVGAGTAPGLPERALITAATATRGSGGISTTGFSRDTGGGGLAGRATTLVDGHTGGGPGGRGRADGTGTGQGNGLGSGSGSGAGPGSARGGTLQRDGSGRASRSIEEIKLVFERHKGAIYALYNRALRDEPALQGKVVLELKIAPSGAVLACRIVSSELRAAELERKLLARITQFDFGAKDVAPMTVTWPVDFLPS
ncbi:MAG: TonB family protein [Burkholderiales bacterium]|nr:TonB family protein [Burkholderiales bacterium]